MGKLHAGHLAIRCGLVGVGKVEHDTLDQGAKVGDHFPCPAWASCSSTCGFHLQVVGVVHIAGLQHSPGGRGGISSPFQLHPAEGQGVGIAVVGVGFVDHHIPRGKIHHPVGTGAHGHGVGRGLPTIGPVVPSNMCLGSTMPLGAGKHQIPGGVRLREGDLDGGVVQGFYRFDRFVGTGSVAGHLWIGDELVGKGHILGGKGGAVGPE
jgi:hypothetical protein